MSNPTLICKHFGCCGGCLHQDLPYEQQLEQKAAGLRQLFEEFWTGPIPVFPSPALFHYRNKIDPGFALKRYPEPPPKDFPRETVLGFKQRGRWRWPIEIEECLIAPEGVSGLLRAVRDWRNENGLAAYDSKKGTGRLRNLLVRDGKRSGERMVVLITTPGPMPDGERFVTAVREWFRADSIYHGEFSGKAEVATADKLTLLEGRPCITETLHITDAPGGEPDCRVIDTPSQFLQVDQRDCVSLQFRISPLSFFQTNPLAAERLYGLIRDWVAPIHPERLYDLYGGAGGIALSCAKHAGQIISVENVAEASEDGRFNAECNGIDNVAFVTDSVRNYLRHRLEEGGLPPGSAVILDPPRAGMHPKAIKRLLEMGPQHVLYVSCNPARLKEEMSAFRESYNVAAISAVDMFPHTPHVEVVASLERH